MPQGVKHTNELGTPSGCHYISPNKHQPKSKRGSHLELCHPERSEGSGSMGSEILRFAQDDSVRLVRLMPIGCHYISLFVIKRNRALVLYQRLCYAEV
jgi:hypothetical protein